MIKVMITGGSGFIGRHATQEILMRGHSVVVYDVTDPGIKDDRVEFRQGSVTDALGVSRAMAGCTHVLHLAGVLGVKAADEDLLGCLAVNGTGAFEVLRAAASSTNKPRVLLSSSSEVFGDATFGGLKEDALFNPKSGYAVSKLMAECWAKAFWQDGLVDATVMRYFNIYGPGQRFDFVLPRFVRQALDGKPITVYGTGEQVRAFCFVADAVRATIDLLFETHGTAGQVFNIGNPTEPVTMLRLAELVSEVVCLGDSQIRRVAFENSDRTKEREIFHRLPDVGKISNALGYTPKVSLKDGIAELAAAMSETEKDPVLL